MKLNNIILAGASRHSLDFQETVGIGLQDGQFRLPDMIGGHLLSGNVEYLITKRLGIICMVFRPMNDVFNQVRFYRLSVFIEKSGNESGIGRFIQFTERNIRRTFIKRPFRIRKHIRHHVFFAAAENESDMVQRLDAGSEHSLHLNIRIFPDLLKFINGDHNLFSTVFHI